MVVGACCRGHCNPDLPQVGDARPPAELSSRSVVFLRVGIAKADRQSLLIGWFMKRTSSGSGGFCVLKVQYPVRGLKC